MLLERIGKFYFSQKTSLLFYILILFPLVLGGAFLSFQYAELQNLKADFYQTCKKGKIALLKKKTKEDFIRKHANTHPCFLENLESTPFLFSEIQELENLIRHPAIADKQALKARLNFLTKGANCLRFTEEAIHSSSSIKETEEKQLHPVQMNEEDIKKLLSSLEEIPIESYPALESLPQIIITDFHLEKKQTPLKTDVFEVDMQFIKREFIP